MSVLSLSKCVFGPLILASLFLVQACDSAPQAPFGPFSGKSASSQDSTAETSSDTSSQTDQPGTVVLNDSVTADADPLAKFRDCEGKLPCSWESSDQGISVVLEAVYSDNGTDNLEVAYTISTTRDTRLQLIDSASAIDSSGSRYTAKPAVIGFNNNYTNSATTADLLAGIPLTVTQAFRESPAHSVRSIERLMFDFIESGVTHQVGLLSLPLDAHNDDGVDCNLQLPCTWTAVNNEFTVAVILVEAQASGRLVIHYQVDALEDIIIKADTDSIAIGSEGTSFVPKIHSLGDESDYRAFEKPMIKDSGLAGTQSYFRVADLELSYLKKLTLKLTQVGAPVAGVPVFSNLPLN